MDVIRELCGQEENAFKRTKSEKWKRENQGSGE
jgi:hypothetical protein